MHKKHDEVARKQSTKDTVNLKGIQCRIMLNIALGTISIVHRKSSFRVGNWLRDAIIEPLTILCCIRGGRNNVVEWSPPLPRSLCSAAMRAVTEGGAVPQACLSK